MDDDSRKLVDIMARLDERKKVYDFCFDNFGPQNRITIESQYFLAEAEAQAGNWTKALDLIDDVLENSQALDEDILFDDPVFNNMDALQAYCAAQAGDFNLVKTLAQDMDEDVAYTPLWAQPSVVEENYIAVMNSLREVASIQPELELALEKNVKCFMELNTKYDGILTDNLKAIFRNVVSIYQDMEDKNMGCFYLALSCLVATLVQLGNDKMDSELKIIFPKSRASIYAVAGARMLRMLRLLLERIVPALEEVEDFFHPYIDSFVYTVLDKVKQISQEIVKKDGDKDLIKKDYAKNLAECLAADEMSDEPPTRKDLDEQRPHIQAMELVNCSEGLENVKLYSNIAALTDETTKKEILKTLGDVTFAEVFTFVEEQAGKLEKAYEEQDVKGMRECYETLFGEALIPLFGEEPIPDDAGPDDIPDYLQELMKSIMGDSLPKHEDK